MAKILASPNGTSLSQARRWAFGFGLFSFGLWLCGCSSPGAMQVETLASEPVPVQQVDGELGAEVGDNSALLASACTGCHSSHSAQQVQTMASLQGLPAAYIEQRMRWYQQDTNGSTVMHRIARGYSLEQIQRLSLHLSRAATKT